MAEEVAHPHTVRLEVAAPSREAAPVGPAPSLQAGVLVRSYELVRPIASGAVGSVFLARDLRLGRRVAIKFLISSDPGIGRRVLVEAQATARCVHENIVVIHEVGSWQGMPFIVLEYLDGPALSAVLRGGSLSVARALELIAPVIRALGCAHRAGIVHRDLKPDNVIVTRAGTVKVLDFGIAKLFHSDLLAEHESVDPMTHEGYETLSGPGRVVGTLPYMAPEQWRGQEVDARCDLFAVGVILFRMLTGQHPSGSFAGKVLRAAALSPQEYPSLARVAPTLPPALVALVDRCLRKAPEDRFPDADALLAAIEATIDELRSQARSRPAEECPYLGLSQFTAADAGRFFGREREVTAALSVLRRSATLAVVGPSGSGKSSLVLAGIASSLRGGLHGYDTISLRPGRAPLASLLEVVRRHAGAAGMALTQERLQREPGALGVVLREVCQARRTSLLVVIDQFEELFTLASSEAIRRPFIDALLAAADDVSSPVRLALTLRSDFLHRVAEHPWLTEVVSEGMLLLTPPDRTTLRAALVGPLTQVGYALEDEALGEEILGELEASAVPLPLLQLVGTELWSQRDRQRRQLSREGYREIGGVHGALAGQADKVLAGLSRAGRALARSMLLRLVTSEGTRAVVDRADLLAMSPESGTVLATLVSARLVVAQEDDESVELIHEALIEQWPALRGWIQESRDDVALRDRVAGAARQWVDAGRPSGSLWSGDALAEVRALRTREVALGAREREFLDASHALANRSARRRRVAVTAALVALALVAGTAVVGLAAVRRAEGEARAHAAMAVDEARRAQLAERSLSEKIAQLERKERERAQAEREAADSREIAEQRRGEVERGRVELEAALVEAQAAARRASRLAEDERRLRESLADALARERGRVEELRRQRSKIEQSLR
ncbi:MAG: protein kinase [Kofleriaceae bacterium]